MKLSDGIVDVQSTGICKLDLNVVSKKFGEHSTISRWHEEYRLVNLRARVKVTISKEQAFNLIKMLNLVEYKSPIFANAGTFMTASRLERVKESDKVPVNVMKIHTLVLHEINELPIEMRAGVMKNLTKALKGSIKIYE